MKKIGKIKLNQFSKEELDRRKLNALKGGCDCRDWCSCSCSSTDAYGASNTGSTPASEQGAGSYLTSGGRGRGMGY